MSDHVLKTIDQLREEIEQVEKTIRPKKLLVNQLCEVAGIAPAFTGLEDQQAPSAARIRRNEFYGQPLSTCIRKFLEMRATLPVKEATLDEIFAALKEGGYDVRTSGSTEEDQKRGIAIAIGKNSQTFHRLPTGDYGLVSWYPNIKERKAKPESAPAASQITAPPGPLPTDGKPNEAKEEQPA